MYHPFKSLIIWAENTLRFFLFIFCVSLLVSCQLSFETTPAPTLINLTPSPTPQSIRIPGKSTLGLVELWRFHTGLINGGSHGSPPHIRTTESQLTISYHTSNDYDSLLMALSLDTGQVVWQTRLKKYKLKTPITSSHLDDERLYLVYSFRINAFSLETGELLWSTPDPERPGGHTSYDFRPWEPDNPLLVHSSADEVLAIDPRTGEILYRQAEKDILIQKDQIGFECIVGEGLRVVDYQSDEVLWGGGYCIKRWPSFIGDDMLFEAGQVCYDITRANVQTGQVIWKTLERNYLSNFAVSGSRVYALREDLTLVAFDLDTGTILGTLQFDGPPAETICHKVGGTVYWVVANGPYVLVYFGDTHELIALKEKDIP